ncbi:hypothetical protein FACS189434_05940 [Bacteroidia bacterium]|nr:hypothetical protein FACS189434_05940 [Bacteroidia bacterium]
MLYVIRKITSFYDNVNKKYPHTYSYEDVDRDVLRVYNEALKVATNELWRKNDMKSVRGWDNYNVEYSNKTGWYFAYKIKNNVIYIEDAENHRNMSEEAFRC